jgi:serine/threonine protein kinase/Tfp pilus assembly protein PilF
MDSDESGSRYVLLDELAEEFADRYRRGERPSLQEYVDRFPELAADICQLFPALAGLERAKEVTGSGPGPAPGPVPPLREVGDFRLIREVGRGGMGVVYEAEQVSLGRRVALKVLPRQFGGEAARERFRREARAAARLHHTNIVPVFEVGEEGAVCYYAMQFILGQSLDEVVAELRRLREGSAGRATGAAPAPAGTGVWQPALSDVARSLLTGRLFAAEPAGEAAPGGVATLARPAPSPAVASLGGSGGSSSAALHGSTPLPASRADRRHYFQSVAHVGQQTATALAYAHARGVVHRDVKPSNLLLDAAGVVWVTDFGLAKTADAALTETGDMVGTVRYMAPERFHGECDARADVYGLGLTLYELLTLRPAFDAPDRLRLLDQVKSREPPRPRALDPRVPRDLETVVLKAIDKDAHRRYQTAEEMAEDLRRFAADEPIRARQPSRRERVWRWGRRHPGVAALSGAVAVLLVLAAAGGVLTANHFARLAQREADARHDAERARADAVRQRYSAEEAFRAARTAVDNLTRVSECELLRVPGMQPVRREMLGQALTYYQDFLARRGYDPKLRGELADAYARAARITAEIGSRAEAIGLQEKGLELRRELYERAPVDRGLALRQADDDLALAALLRQAGELAGARQAYREAYALLLEFSPQDPNRTGEVGLPGNYVSAGFRVHECGDAEIQRRFADALLEASLVEAAAGERSRAGERLYESIYAQQFLVAGHPGHAQRLGFERGLAARWLRLGETLGDAGQTDTALACLARARDLLSKLVRDHPSADEAAESRRDLALAWENTGALEIRAGRLREAIAAYATPLPVRREFAERNPAVTEYQADLARTCRELGEAYTLAGDGSAALGVLRDGLRRQQSLAGGLAGERSHVRDLARYHLTLARAYRLLARPAEALASFDAAGRTLEGLPPAGAEEWYLLATARAGCGNLAGGADHGAAAGGLSGPALATVLTRRTAEYRRASAALGRAAGAGFADLARLNADRVFDPMRGGAEFRALTEEIAGKLVNPLWEADYEVARTRAARELKDLLLYFCGSDWDGGDKGLREKYLNGTANRALAAELVAVEFDNPRHRPKPRDFERGMELARRYRITYRPTLVLADAAGRAYARIEETTLSNEDLTPERFVERIRGLRATRARRDELLGRAADVCGAARAAALDRALATVPPEFHGEYAAEAREVVSLDAADAAGLRTKHLYQSGGGEPEAGPAPDPAGRDRDAAWKLMNPPPVGEIRRFKRAWWRSEVAWTGRHPVAFCSLSDRSVRLWEAVGRREDTGRPRAALEAALGPAAELVRFWRRPEERTFVGHTDALWGLALSPDGARVLTCSTDGTVRLWERRTGNELHRWLVPNRQWVQVAFAPDGRLAACGAADGIVSVFDADAGGQPRALAGHEGQVQAVAFAADGRHLVTGGDDGTLRLWDADAGREVRRFETRLGQLLRVAVSNDGRRVLACAISGAAGLWDYASGRPLLEVRVPGGGGYGARHAGAFTPDGRHFLTGFDNQLTLWDSATGREVLRFRVPEKVTGLAVAPDGRHAFTCDAAGVYRLFPLTADAARAAELMRTGPVQAAIAAWDRVAAPDPDEPGWYLARARLYARAEQWDKVAADLRAASRLDPFDGDVWADGGRCRALQGEWQGAANNFVGAVASVTEGAERDRRRKSLFNELAQWEPAIAEVLERDPQNVLLWQIRGCYHARQGRWAEAAADFRRATAADPNDPYSAFQSAPLQVCAGEVTNYRRLRRHVLNRFGRTNDPGTAERTARICLLLPTEDDRDLDRLAALTVRVLARRPPGDNSYEFGQLARAMVAYRNGDSAAAAKRLAPLVDEGKSHWWGLECPALLVLAMARHGSGRADEARATLKREAESWHRNAPATPAAAGEAWHDWLTCRILRGEAEEVVLKGNAAASRAPRDWRPLPDDWETWTGRGRDLLAAGRLREAGEAFARAAELCPHDQWLSYQTAALLAAAGDDATFDRHRHAMLGRWGDAADTLTAERVGKACLLRPASGQDLERAVELTEWAERSLKRTDWLVPYVELVRGLAEYRQGAFDAAERRLERLVGEGEPPWNVAGPAWSTLALVRFRQGKSDAAREALRRATDILQAIAPGMRDPDENGWHDVFITEALHREAEAAVVGGRAGAK